MTLNNIYNEYVVGSQGFCIAVETHCGFEISRTEIERIAVAFMESLNVETGDE